MKPKALVFFDLDGTLLNDQSKIDSDVIEAIQTMKENNIIPFIATGRSPIEIQKIAKGSGIDSFIGLNGQIVQYEDKEVFRSVIAKDLLVELKKMADQVGLPLSYYSADAIRVSKITETVKDAYKFINEDTPQVDEHFYEKEEILMSLVINDNREEDGPFIEKFPEFSFYRNTPFSMDVINKGHSKATGIDALIKDQGLEGVPMYAFGDGRNDLEMFDRVDVAIAMENGYEDVKAAADYVTASNIDGGILKALKKYDLI